MLSTGVVVLTRDCEISDTKTECYSYYTLAAYTKYALVPCKATWIVVSLVPLLVFVDDS